MSLRVTFELSDKDLRHFRRIMRESLQSAKTLDTDNVVAAAKKLLGAAREQATSDFVTQRLARLQVMIDMLQDGEWQIPVIEHTRVIAALSYFAEEDDLVSDSIPGLGLLDDAIMIELIVRDLRHEIEAYEDFCAFRRDQGGEPKSSESSDERNARLTKKRVSLHERMRRRARRQRGTRRRGGGPRLSLF